MKYIVKFIPLDDNRPPITSSETISEEKADELLDMWGSEGMGHIAVKSKSLNVYGREEYAVLTKEMRQHYLMVLSTE